MQLRARFARACRPHVQAPERLYGWDALQLHHYLVAAVTMVAALYASSLRGGFVYDDHWVLVGNGFLHSRGDLAFLFGPEGARLHIPDVFRPVSVLFDIATMRVFGSLATAHRVVSLGLHMLNVVLVGTWLTRLSLPARIAGPTAVLFAVLAVHVETVGIVSFREDLLATTFGLSALHLACRATRARAMRIPIGLGVWALSAVACLSKLSMAPLALVYIATLALAPPRSRQHAWWMTAAMLLGCASALAHRMHVLGVLSPYVTSTDALPWNERLAVVLFTTVHAWTSCLWPQTVAIEYPRVQPHLGDGSVIAWALAAVLLAGWWLRWGRRRPVARLVLFGFAAWWLPVSGLVALPNLRADRYLYAPSMFVCLGVVYLLMRAKQRAGACILLALIVLNAITTRQHMEHVRNDTQLWTHAVARAPNSPRAHAILSELLVGHLAKQAPYARQHGELAKARAHCDRAQALAPSEAWGALCAARLSILDKRWDAAHHLYGQALARHPRLPERAEIARAAVTLDAAASAANGGKMALDALYALGQRYPYATEVFAEQARIAHRLGQPGQALAALKTAQELGPRRADLTARRLELALDLGDAVPSPVARAQILRALSPVVQHRLTRRFFLHDQLSRQHP